MGESENKLIPALREILREAFLLAPVKKRKAWRFRSIKKPGFTYKEKTVKVDSSRHQEMLRRTLEHLSALKAVYQAGSSNRHVLSQACIRIKRLLKQLERSYLYSG